MQFVVGLYSVMYGRYLMHCIGVSKSPSLSKPSISNEINPKFDNCMQGIILFLSPFTSPFLLPPSLHFLFPYNTAISSITILRGREKEGRGKGGGGGREGEGEERRRGKRGGRENDNLKFKRQYFRLTVSSSSQWPVRIWCRGPEE